MLKRDLNLTAASLQSQLAMLCLSLSICSIADTTQLEIPASVDTAKWECDYCAFERGFEGEIELGAGYVSEKSYKFGEYNGLYDEGAYAIGNAWMRYRDENAGYLDLKVRDLGLNNRSVEIEGGRQGSYSLHLNYDEISHYISDSGMTPYVGNGGDTLTLPSGWVTAGSTAGMTALDSSLRGTDIHTIRKRVGVGIDFIPARKWEGAVDVRHETREGQQRIAGSFFFNTAQLVAPVNYVTDEVEAAVTYTTREWQTRLAYYVSLFNNEDSSLTWQNAYNPITAGADSGSLALPPDNQFHQILMSTGYQYSDRTRFSGDFAIGRMIQNEDLLAATNNPNLSVTLPRNTANAEVETLTANLKVDTTVNDKLRLNASWRYNDRDNRTPSNVFNWVTTDAFIAPPRQNLPYSFIDQIAKLEANYRVSRLLRLNAGYENAKKRRSNQEVYETTENTFWGKASVRTNNSVDLTFKAAHAKRDSSGYNPVAEITPAENPLMRKYNMADRIRDTGSVLVGVNLNERINIGLGVELARDDYTDSLLGLTGSRETSYNADFTMILTEMTSLHAYGNLELIKSEQAGSQTYSTPDWFASNDDTIESLGFGMTHKLIDGKLDVGIDYVLTNSTGKINVNAGAPGSEFPDLETSLHSLKLTGNYRLQEDLTLHAEFWYEHYSSKDWMLDGVEPGTIPNVISFGGDSPDYNEHVTMISARYHF